MHGAAGRPGRIIDSLESAHALFAPVFARARDERLYIAHLDGARQLIGIRIRYAADAQKVGLPVRDIIADALSLGSKGLVLAHNHPAGDPTPSPSDVAATRALIQLARPLGVAVREHLVFAGSGFVSFRQRGLL